MSDLINQFIESVEGPTNAAVVLCVSGAIIHKWKAGELSTLAIRRITAWFRFPDERARFILRNVWSRGAVWHPARLEYDEWLEREMIDLWNRSGKAAWVSELWNEVTT